MPSSYSITCTSVYPSGTPNADPPSILYLDTLETQSEVPSAVPSYDPSGPLDLLHYNNQWSHKIISVIDLINSMCVSIIK